MWVNVVIVAVVVYCHQCLESGPCGFGFVTVSTLRIWVYNSINIGQTLMVHYLLLLLVQGRKTMNIVAACVYIVCRQKHFPIMLIDISDKLAVNVYVLGKVCGVGWDGRCRRGGDVRLQAVAKNASAAFCSVWKRAVLETAWYLYN